jgi:hypothetical protein
MPFCPNCRAEYYPDIKRCADCGVALVAQLPEGATGDPLADAALTPVCETENRTEALQIRLALDQHGIPSLLFGDRVLVPAADAERSLETIKRFFETSAPAAPAEPDLVPVCAAPDQFLSIAVAAMLQREGITVVTRPRRDDPGVELLVQQQDAGQARSMAEAVLNALAMAAPGTNAT